MPLNGASANTEGGRLARLMRPGRMCYRGDVVSTGSGFCKPKDSVQTPITPTSDSRTNTLTATINGTQLNGGWNNPGKGTATIGYSCGSFGNT